MVLDSPRRVHIAPLGYEKERIYQAAIEEDADKIVLLVHDSDEDGSLGAECRTAVIDALEGAGIEYEQRQCNIFNLEEALAEFQSVIYQHQQDVVFVNISTGSKITAVAGMMACMMFGGTPYYVKPEYYGKSTVSEGVQEVFSVATYPIDPPNEDTIQILEFIRDQTENGEKVIISDLNKFVNEKQLSAVRDLNRENSQSIYDIVQREYLQPLKERDLIRVQRFGTEKQLTVTEQGKRLIDFSQYVLESD